MEEHFGGTLGETWRNLEWLLVGAWVVFFWRNNLVSKVNYLNKRNFFRYFEGSTANLPAYINEIFEEIDEDIEESEKNQTGAAEDKNTAEEKNSNQTNLDQGPDDSEEIEVKLEEEDSLLPDTDKLEDDDDLPQIGMTKWLFPLVNTHRDREVSSSHYQTKK